MSAQQDFADLKFRIECSHIVLTQVGGARLVVRGPGEIWQDKDGVLQYKIFTDQAAYRELQAYMGRPVVIGQIIPDEQFFNLQAQEHALPIWNATRILPSLRGGLQGGLAHGYIDELTQARAIPARPNADSVEVRFKGKLDFPCNQGTQTIVRVGGQERHTSSSFNVAFAEDGEYRFETRHENDHSIVSLQLPPGQLTHTTASRIREALQFILGKQLAMLVAETSSAGEQVTRFISPFSERGHGDIPPPIRFHRIDEGGNIWRMFCNYFRRVHAENTPRWHPISCHIGSVIEASAASLDTEILALGVAVEGLVAECFPNLAPVSADFLRELDSVQAAVRSVMLTVQSRARINGSINAMRSPRNSDILRAFLASNNLPPDLFESWRRLRNTSAHGGGAGGHEIETILRLRNEVLSLLYSIAFAAINYSGPRTDYSLPGWPTRPWPVPQPPTAPHAPAPTVPPPASAPVAVTPPVSSPPAPTATLQTPPNTTPPEPTNSAST